MKHDLKIEQKLIALGWIDAAGRSLTWRDWNPAVQRELRRR